MKRDETGMNKTTGDLTPLYIDEEEERYRLAVEAAELGTWDYYPLSGTMIWNDRCRALLGMNGDKAPGYDVFLQQVHPGDREQVNRALRELCISTQQQSFHCEFRTVTQKNNQPQWIRLYGKVYYNEQGKACRCIGMLADISEKKVAERSVPLQKLTADLARSNQYLEEFAFMVSHDLQEPLRKIRIFTQLLQDTMNTGAHDTNRLYLEKINASAIRMGALIRSLLDYSRLSGKTAQFVSTSLNEIIKTVVTDLEITISRNHAIIDVGPLPVIEAIPIQMVQLFTNLMTNALKFTCKNTPSVIRIACRKMTQAEVMYFPALNPQPEYIEVTVADNGIGFDPAFSEQIFGIFQRLHGQNQYEGTGIGLSICRKIVINHNGLIFADSKKDEGTTFHVILPVKQH